MQWSLNWYDFIFIYAVEYLPYVLIFILIVFAIRDVFKRKLHKSTIVVTALTLLSFIIVKLLAVAL